MRFRVLILIFVVFGYGVSRGQNANGEALRRCDNIVKAYSKCRSSFTYNNRTFYFPATNSSVTCSDGVPLRFYDRMRTMDVASILMLNYLPGTVPLPVVSMNQDPGRLRLEDLLKSVYGRSEEAVQSNLVQVKFLGRAEWFQRRNGAALALKRVNDELLTLMASDAQVRNFLQQFMGTTPNREVYTFEWRFVAGTKRLSPHSFGTAIDLVTHVGPQYWLWEEEDIHPDMAAQGEVAYENFHYVPPSKPVFNAKVIQAFERNGFIWGGKWNHFDTMHFEYRPEFYNTNVVDCALERK